MEKIFDPILDEDEKIVKIFKPKKSVVYAKSFLRVILVFLFFGICFVPSIILGATEENIDINKTILFTLTIYLGILIVTLLMTWWFLSLYYKNVYFGYTNKRIVIRKGIFGVDYQTLDIKMIGASDVNVTLFDKILRKNTGSIRFGSTASPLLNANNVSNFMFASIENPYEIYKEIKSFISKTTEKQG